MPREDWRSALPHIMLQLSCRRATRACTRATRRTSRKQSTGHVDMKSRTTVASDIQLISTAPASLNTASKPLPKSSSRMSRPRRSKTCGCANCATPGRALPVSCAAAGSGSPCRKTGAIKGELESTRSIVRVACWALYLCDARPRPSRQLAGTLVKNVVSLQQQSIHPCRISIWGGESMVSRHQPTNMHTLWLSTCCPRMSNLARQAASQQRRAGAIASDQKLQCGTCGSPAWSRP